MGELLALAAEAAGGRHHLVAVQMPVSLVMMTPITQALHGRGPRPAAAGAGLRAMASAPLHGGELPGMVDQELANLIRPGLTLAQACVLAVAPCPGVTDVLLAASGAPHWEEAPKPSPNPRSPPPSCGRSLVYSPPPDPDIEQHMRSCHARAAKALDVREPGGEFWGWAGRTQGASPQNKASGKLWGGALDAQHVFGDLDGRRPALLAVHDAVDDDTAYRAELSVRVGQPVLSDDPVLQRDLQLPGSWWQDLTGTLEKVAAVDTDRIAVRQQYMDRASPNSWASRPRP
jgi:hypothetical protein